MPGELVNGAVQFSFNRDAEQCWAVTAVTDFVQLTMQVAQHCVAKRFGREISLSLNGIAVNRVARANLANSVLTFGNNSNRQNCGGPRWVVNSYHVTPSSKYGYNDPPGVRIVG